jgi:2-polyprenyl-6-methoxyphenol hydroxylase-like FAD-dependent oxidoreductase
MAQRQGDGSYRLSFGLQAPEGDFSRNGSVDVRDSDGVRQLLLSQFYADWSEDYKAMIRHSTSFQAWPLYTLSRVGLTWHSVSGATLAGDAAHLSYPGGEGVNLAMTDAWKLASKIAEHGPNELDTAVQEYEADMFARASTAMAASEAMERVMYSTDPQAFVELICS